MHIVAPLTLLMISGACGSEVHHSLKGHLFQYLKSAPWRHTKTFAKIKTPISIDIISNYRLQTGTIINGNNFGSSKNCADILRRQPSNRGRNGIYTIYPEKKKPVKVYCDMTTDGGGWTVIQKRFDGTTTFYRNWKDYKKGFGNMSGEFWLGNDIIHVLTKNGDQELRLEMTKFSGSKVYAKYSRFSIGDESKRFKLSISGYSGNAGDFITGYHNLNGMAFSTKDNDNDNYGSNCAVAKHGAWWYNACSNSDLNSKYTQKQRNSFSYLNWGNSPQNMRETKMMIRRKY